VAFELTAKQREMRDKVLLAPAKHSLLYGGSRSGKTALYCYGISTRALRASGSRHGIFRRHGVVVKQTIGADTLPKVLNLAYGLRDGAGFKYYEQDGLFLFPNESEIWLAGLEDKERLDKALGREYASVYKNEASELPYSAHLMLKTRLAQAVKVTVGEGLGELLPLKDYTDLNPTKQSHWTYKLFQQGIEPETKRPVDRSDYAFGQMNPGDNAVNLPPGYVAELAHLPPGAKKRFHDGEYAGDAADALWTRSSIQRMFAADERMLPKFKRIVVAIDPPASSNSASDEAGIIVAATDETGKGYVLADGSGIMRPEDWARKSVTLFNYYHADSIVAEANQGGEMVEAVIRSVNPNLPVKLVHATRGKYIRAEPVAALYARGRVEHVGEFETLEDQMVNFTADYDRSLDSPDRVDALVWAMTELFPFLIEDRRDRRARQAVAQDYDPFSYQSSTYRDRQATAGMDYDPF
jgi:hypothetical protein